MTKIPRLCRGLLLLLLLAWPPAADAADGGTPILWVETVPAAATGMAGQPFTLDDLKAMGAVEIHTSTPWTAGIATFTGVPLASVLQGVRTGQAGLQAVALNDYVVDMPIDEILAYEPVLAWAQDGREMSVRQRGPLWLVFDFDRFPETQNEVFLSRSIWQLKILRLRD